MTDTSDPFPGPGLKPRPRAPVTGQEVRSGSEILFDFGAGEAKGELEQQMTHDKLNGRIVSIETADKLTEPQIAAKIRHYFFQIIVPVLPSPQEEKF